MSYRQPRKATTRPRLTAEERQASFEAVAKLVSLAQRFLRNEVDRRTAEAEALALDLGLYAPRRPRLSGAANALRDLLVNLTEEDDGPAVRELDIAGALNAVLAGEVSIAPTEMAVLALPITVIAERTSTVPERSWLEGIGFIQTVQFGSWATSRAFIGLADLTQSPTSETTILSWGVPEDSTALAQVVSDLMDTLGIDLELVVHPDDIDVAKWAVMRSDDNGNEAVVATYTAYRRALARVGELEQHRHKQSYWVERFEEPD